MSEIVADHLKDRDKIEIYDPACGSGSLLLKVEKCWVRTTSSGAFSGRRST